MATPELMVADAAYKEYPGGVIVLRCVDWLGSARGTLSTENDARAITGQVVRDSQKVTGIFSAGATAFANALDTLIIDTSILPLEIDMGYLIWLSFLIEGDWDVTNTDTLTGANQSYFASACNISFYDSVHDPTRSQAGTNSLFDRPRKRSHFMMSSINDFPRANSDFYQGDEIIHLRAYAETGTTIEFLLDQIFFIPFVSSGTHGEWRTTDFQRVGGGVQDFSVVLPLDGGDGGDINGKYTWWRDSLENPLSFSGADGGGDYQKSASEYQIRTQVDDAFFIENSVTDLEASAHGYSVLGANYIDQQQWMVDNFSRSITIAAPSSGGWGTSPEGFGWRWSQFISGTQSGVNGSEAVIRCPVGSARSMEFGLRNSSLQTALTANLDGDPNLSYTGKFYLTGLTASDIKVIIGVLNNNFLSGTMYRIEFNATSASWKLAHSLADISSTFDISSWFGAGAVVGFRLEIKRYIIRVRVWDASGAEPSTWDFEGFRPLPASNSNFATWYNYPYDSVDRSQVANTNLNPRIQLTATTVTTEFDLRVDNITVEYNPYGPIANVFETTERPETFSLGNIEVPSGAWHAIYWGLHDWTDLDSFNLPEIVFSNKAWNHTSAAQLQRAEAPFYWFRSHHGGGPIDLSKIRYRAYQLGDVTI